MASINQVVLSGRLGGEPEITVINGRSGEIKKASFSLAQGKFKKKEDGSWDETTMWFSVVCWGNQASLSEKLQKGEPITIAGKIDIQTWTDKKTGEIKSKFVIEANQVEYNGKRNLYEDQAQSTTQPAGHAGSQTYQQAYPQQPSYSQQQGFSIDNNDDLPF